MQSVGSILRQARQQQQISLEDASAQTKIHIRFLQALETGDYSVFSSPIHIRGFVKNYAQVLGLRPERVLAFWRREYKALTAVGKKRAGVPALKQPRWVWTPAMVGVTAFVTLSLVFLAFLYTQYHQYTSAPYLQVTTPADGQVVVASQLPVAGRVGGGSSLTLNGQTIEVSEEGEFLATISVVEGKNSLYFKAKNKFGKEALAELTVFFVVDSGGGP